MNSIFDCDAALAKLLKATLEREKLVAQRDQEVFTVQQKYANAIAKEAKTIATLEAEIEEWCTEHQAELETDGKKSRVLTNGTLGFRAASNPALVPLSDKWTWESIARKLKRVYELRFFHEPKPPAPDKVKLKKELSAEELAKVGLKLDETEKFFYELNRLSQADPQKATAA